MTGSSIVGSPHGIRYAFSTKIHEFKVDRKESNFTKGKRVGWMEGKNDISRVRIFLLSSRRQNA